MVYVGFNMDKIEKAVAADTRNTIIRIIVLLLIGSSAIISFFLVQAYRLTRSTLSRMRAFSETLVKNMPIGLIAVSYTHLRAHETVLDLVCRLLLEKKNNYIHTQIQHTCST